DRALETLHGGCGGPLHDRVDGGLDRAALRLGPGEGARDPREELGVAEPREILVHRGFEPRHTLPARVVAGDGGVELALGVLAREAVLVVRRSGVRDGVAADQDRAALDLVAVLRGALVELV